MGAIVVNYFERIVLKHLVKRIKKPKQTQKQSQSHNLGPYANNRKSATLLRRNMSFFDTNPVIQQP